ncbi:hypothetical protein AMAG_10130 [Allomyces macrogynus ATCC 38327]|uniref:Adhesin domain-containing protein n=1 Tax=Allomyces macrogynus (strain ATCC 38327) TaxID=578462 RepID=A0A0L0SQK8_ALLM3|nr:hypothetical protein AMAG_10130 [Allomyces macrogynus ATCC 38327]|eukprot:KNE64787.1 hypothetical protein AMAG_10130 [Allomyces macrogynus ATCC 38327]
MGAAASTELGPAAAPAILQSRRRIKPHRLLHDKIEHGTHADVASLSVRVVHDDDDDFSHAAAALPPEVLTLRDRHCAGLVLLRAMSPTAASSSANTPPADALATPTSFDAANRMSAASMYSVSSATSSTSSRSTSFWPAWPAPGDPFPAATIPTFEDRANAEFARDPNDLAACPGRAAWHVRVRSNAKRLVAGARVTVEYLEDAQHLTLIVTIPSDPARLPAAKVKTWIDVVVDLPVADPTDPAAVLASAAVRLDTLTVAADRGVHVASVVPDLHAHHMHWVTAAGTIAAAGAHVSADDLTWRTTAGGNIVAAANATGLAIQVARRATLETAAAGDIAVHRLVADTRGSTIAVTANEGNIVIGELDAPHAAADVQVRRTGAARVSGVVRARSLAVTTSHGEIDLAGPELAVTNNLAVVARESGSVNIVGAAIVGGACILQAGRGGITCNDTLSAGGPTVTLTANGGHVVCRRDVRAQGTIAVAVRGGASLVVAGAVQAQDVDVTVDAPGAIDAALVRASGDLVLSTSAASEVAGTRLPPLPPPGAGKKSVPAGGIVVGAVSARSATLDAVGPIRSVARATAAGTLIPAMMVAQSAVVARSADAIRVAAVEAGCRVDLAAPTIDAAKVAVGDPLDGNGPRKVASVKSTKTRWTLAVPATETRPDDGTSKLETAGAVCA